MSINIAHILLKFLAYGKFYAQFKLSQIIIGGTMNDIKNTLKYIYSLCPKLEQANITPSETGMSLHDYLQLTLMKYMIYIAENDGVIEKNEVMLLNEYLGLSITNSIQAFVSTNVITDDNIFDSMSKCVKMFVTADSVFGTDNGSLSLMFVNFVDNLGIEYISYDGKRDEKQAYQIGDLVSKLKTLRNIIIGNRQFIKNAPAATVPKETANDNALKNEDGNNNSASKKEDEVPIVSNENCGTLEELMEELNELSGLQQVKNDLNSLINLLKVKKLREERGFPQSDISLHMVFSGNPGTGKTTVARLISKIYYRLGVLTKGHLVEVDRSGLVGGFVGQTAIKTKKVCDSAVGGLLFIDEAYSLSNGSPSDFGIEAINTILKAMEDNRNDFVVIAAGYPQLMDEFLESNPGLRSRFNKIIFFQDYAPQELVEILKNICAKSGLKLSTDAENYTFGFFRNRCGKNIKSFANARDVRNYFEKSLTYQADRIAGIANISDDDLMTLRLEDVQKVVLN